MSLDIIDESSKKKDEESNVIDENSEDSNIESIETVPFISEPIKKKTARVKKASV